MTQISLRQLTDVPEMDAGAPLPGVIYEAGTLKLSYWTTSLDRAALVFPRPRAFKLAPPNDEALTGHPFAKFGLAPYTAYEVSESPWIAELCAQNRVHGLHADAHFVHLRHFIWTFHDETFECIADGYAHLRER